MKNLYKITLALGFSMLMLVIGFFIGLNFDLEKTASSQNSRNFSVDRATFIISIENTFPLVWANEVIPTGLSLFEIIKQKTSEKKIEFSYKDYGGSMGAFITSINGFSNTKDKWWQYYVNGEYAKVGISNYKVQVGDVIEFKLTKELGIKE